MSTEMIFRSDLNIFLAIQSLQWTSEGRDWIPCWKHVETGWVFFNTKKPDFQRVDSLIIIFPGSFPNISLGELSIPHILDHGDPARHAPGKVSWPRNSWLCWLDGWWNFRCRSARINHRLPSFWSITIIIEWLVPWKMKNNPVLTIINSNIQFHDNIQTYHMTNFSFFFLRAIGMVCETDMEKNGCHTFSTIIIKFMDVRISLNIGYPWRITIFLPNTVLFEGMPMYAPFSDRSIHHFELVRTIKVY